MSKYNSTELYETIGTLFKTIPLCAVIEGRAFVVHAGVPSLAGATMYHVGAIGRKALAGVFTFMLMFMFMFRFMFVLCVFIKLCVCMYMCVLVYI
jgi:hypothetical protein